MEVTEREGVASRAAVLLSCRKQTTEEERIFGAGSSTTMVIFGADASSTEDIVTVEPGASAAPHGLLDKAELLAGAASMGEVGDGEGIEMTDYAPNVLSDKEGLLVGAASMGEVGDGAENPEGENQLNLTATELTF